VVASDCSPGTLLTGAFLARNTRRAGRVSSTAPLTCTAQRGYGAPSWDQRNAAGFPLEPLASRITNLSRRMHRIYAPRVVADHLMMQDDFVRLHKFLLEMGDLSGVSDDLRKLIEDEWPELTHKLLPKKPNA
jgi:hypothetical protein